MAKNTSDKPLHVHFSIGKFTLYRVFNSCEALHKYVKSILDKGYDAFCMDYDIRTEKIVPSGRTTDWNTMCNDIFNFGLLLQKTMANGRKHQIYVSETAHKAPKSKKQKRTKSKPGLSAPIAIPDEGYRNWTLVEEDVESGNETYKRFQSHEDALYAFSHRYQDLENAGYLRKNLILNGTAKWEGDYISDSGRTETIKLKIV